MLSLASTPGLSLLRGDPDNTALIADGVAVTYAELGALVRERGAQLGGTRRLVMIAGGNELEPIVTYLAALEGAHPVLFVSGGEDDAGRAHRTALTEQFSPDVIFDRRPQGWILEERNPGSRHAFHPELAVLGSTSGSTGSPKLVRLSFDNLRSNAASIAEYLRLTPSDRAATTLPLHYCYGLSVLNSHLFAGASVLLTERSVTDEAFWREASAHRITSFAGVPYTFEMLEASGFADRSVPSLRYLTQAGGRLAPERIRRFAHLGEQNGFELFVMYGQTEATARMAYLPPELIAAAAGTIGRSIPGGRFRIDASGMQAPHRNEGELIYEGPNVMLGYARTPADFGLGRTVRELRTGDLARRRDDGLYEIVGRMNRFVKIFGLRVDLDRVEEILADEGIDVRVAAADEQLFVFATSERVARRARERAAVRIGVPPHAIEACAVERFPRTPSGKLDIPALLRFAALQARSVASGAQTGSPATSPEMIRALFSSLLSCPGAGLDDSFAALGGDSLSYIEVSLRLEALLGDLPRDWPTRSARNLAVFAAEAAGTVLSARNTEGTAPAPVAEPAAEPDTAAASEARAPFPRLVRLETPAVLRAIAIVLIVGTHADLFGLKGGAHLLLAVAGYNLARFQLAPVSGRSRIRWLGRSAVKLAVPAVLWIGGVALLTGQYTLTTVLLVNNFVPGDGRWNEQWQFWFLEAMLGTLIGLAAVFAVRAVDRIERRWPFAFALVGLAIALGARFAFSGVQADYVERYTGAAVVWLVALGWLIARADSTARRTLVSLVAVASSWGFFGDPEREAILVGGLLVLIWVPALRVPRVLVPTIAALAGASMFIYLTHWQVYPPFEQSAPWLGTLLSLAVGAIAWRGYTLASARVTRTIRSMRLGRRLISPAYIAGRATASSGRMTVGDWPVGRGRTRY